MTFNMHVHMHMHVWRKVKTGTVTREAPVPPPLHPCCHGVPAGLQGSQGRKQQLITAAVNSRAALHGQGHEPSSWPRLLVRPQGRRWRSATERRGDERRTLGPP